MGERKTRKNINKKKVNSRNRMIFLFTGILILILLIAALILFLRQKKENESTVAEQGSEYQEIIQEANDYEESLDTLTYFEIDGDRYEPGAVLADFLANGWEVAGSPDDTEWTYSESDTVEGEDFVTIFLAKGQDEFFQMSIINAADTPMAYAECRVNGIDVYESDFMEVESITINGTEVWKHTVEEVNGIFESQSEDAGECFFYFNVPEELKKQDKMTSIGWSIFAGSDSGDGIIDSISFSQDYQFE